MIVTLFYSAYSFSGVFSLCDIIL
ncbi:Putative transcriptional attenuator leader peptide [Listeria monocytogenes]|uniref:Putative transcriptional attenuator leader peptide n=1 Tax=Listeria monocytogenes TaxID=1639 RepID=O52492_LISMN|nr:putative transcriptional attenuator leader peptide [Listeria monocytogenes]